MSRKLLLAALFWVWCASASRSQPPVEMTPPAETPAGAAVPKQPLADLGLGGMGPLGGMGGPMMSGNGYQLTWLPDQRVNGQPAKLGLVRQDLSASCPLWNSGDGDVLAARLNVRSEQFDTDAILPDSHRAFPSDLYNVSLGLNGTHRFDNGWTAGGMLNLGSASDRPFANIHTLNVGVMAFLRVPSGERDSWMFSLTYSPLGQLQFPLPGVAYSWNPTDEFSMNLGLPLGVRYRPTTDWTFEASYMLLTTVHTQATYRLCDRAGVYGGYDWTNEGYYLTDSAPQVGNSTQRFRYYEMRLNTGFRFTLNSSCTFDLCGGYAFDRTYDQGSGLGFSGTDPVRVDPGPYISGRVRLKW